MKAAWYLVIAIGLICVASGVYAWIKLKKDNPDLKLSEVKL